MTPLKLILVTPFTCLSACVLLMYAPAFKIITRKVKVRLTNNCFLKGGYHCCSAAAKTELIAMPDQRQSQRRGAYLKAGTAPSHTIYTAFSVHVRPLAVHALIHTIRIYLKQLASNDQPLHHALTSTTQCSLFKSNPHTNHRSNTLCPTQLHHGMCVALRRIEANPPTHKTDTQFIVLPRSGEQSNKAGSRQLTVQLPSLHYHI
jgi:hypothetical protein